MFYATLALAVLKEIETSKHSGLIAFFDQEYVKTGVFPKELSKSLHLAFDQRQSNDYGEIGLIDQNGAKKAIVEAQYFVDKIDEYIDTVLK